MKLVYLPFSSPLPDETAGTDPPGGHRNGSLVHYDLRTGPPHVRSEAAPDLPGRKSFMAQRYSGPAANPPSGTHRMPQATFEHRTIVRCRCYAGCTIADNQKSVGPCPLCQIGFPYEHVHCD